MQENKVDPLVQVGTELGGVDTVEAILTAFYKKMSLDLMLGFFFEGKDLSHIISQQRDFLCKAMGLTKRYLGKPPGRAHRAVPPILKGHFDRRLVLLRETLREFGLSEKSIEAWIGFEEVFRKGIVEEEAPLSKRRK